MIERESKPDWTTAQVTVTAELVRPAGMPAHPVAKAASGYDPNFLEGITLPLPRLRVGEGELLHYPHFSILMNRKRRLAWYAAVNVDLRGRVNVRRARDRWTLESRLPEEAQLGVDFYTQSGFDHSRLVKRLQPAWGKDAMEAAQATNTMTNMAPLGAFVNRSKLWVDLPDLVAERLAPAGRMVMFAGPVFSVDDPEYRSIRLPRSYWRLFGFHDGRRFCSLAVLATQDLDSKFFDTEQTMHGRCSTTSVGTLEALTGLSFERFAEIDIMAGRSGQVDTVVDIMAIWSNPPQTAKARGRIEEEARDGQVDTSAPMREERVFLLGSGGAGKTALARRLLLDRFEHTEVTHGIEVHDWSLHVHDREVLIHLWDFGGQQIYYGLQELFLSSRAVYLVVLNARSEDDDAEFWLSRAAAFAGDGPIIVVVTHTDLRARELDRKTLSARYPGIIAYVDTNLVSGEGLFELTHAIAEAIARITPLELPRAWLAVRDRLRHSQENFLDLEDFQAICTACGVSDPQSQNMLSAYLHDLGAILHFADDPYLQSTVVLQPNWLANGIAQIISSRQASFSGGEVKRSDLGRILDPAVYPPVRHEFLLRLIQRFEFALPFPAKDDETWLIPQLLPSMPPKTLTGFRISECLNLRYTYSVWMQALIPRFLVRSEVNAGNRWWDGAVLNSGENRALVRADSERRTIDISIAGPQSGRGALLQRISSTFEAIHKSLPTVSVETSVPLSADSATAIPYDTLLKMRKDGNTTIPDPATGGTFDIRALLGESTKPGTSSKLELRIFDGSRQPFSAPAKFLVTIFDGNQKQLFRDFIGSNTTMFELPFYDNFGDNYRVIVWAEGYKQAGVTPVRLSNRFTTTLDVMLIPNDPGFSFVNARWDSVSTVYPFLADGVDHATGAARYEMLLDQQEKTLACLLNLCEAMGQINLSAGSPLDFLKQLRWDMPFSPTQERLYAWCDPMLIEQIKMAAQAGRFIPVPTGLVQGATSSWKETGFGEANLQLAFHERDHSTIDGADFVMVEVNIHYYRDTGAHVLFEITPNAMTQSVVDPVHVYVLRWMAGRQAGVSEFTPMYTITS
jgi:small GTP-binding protein